MSATSLSEVERSRGAASQMALDEAALEMAPPDAVILRFYRWPGPAVTFGRGQPWQEARRAADSRGWTDLSPVRRPTGGGVVFHDGDVTFSLVFPWEKLCAPSAVYKNIHRGIHQGLRQAGARTAILSQASRAAAGGVCFAAPAHMDLVGPQGDKVLGGALARRRGKGLYQGSLRPEGLALPAAEIEEAVASGVAAEFGSAPRRVLPDGWLRRASELEGRYISEAWNRRV
jgi:lipoate-protein ligase A